MEVKKLLDLQLLSTSNQRLIHTEKNNVHYKNIFHGLDSEFVFLAELL